MNRIVHNRHGLVRVPWRVFLFLLLTGAVVLAVNIAVSPLTRSMMEEERATTLAAMNPWFMALQNAILIVAILLSSRLVARRLDRRPFAGVGLGFHEKWRRELLIGLLTGAAFITAIVYIQMIAGVVHLATGSIPPSDTAAAFLSYAALFISVGILEELLFRGYLLQSFAEGIGKFGAALFLSVPFGIAHFFNEGGTTTGAVATGMAGLLLCIAYFRTRSLYLPIGIHITWNFTMAWVFGLPVSGERLPEPLWRGETFDPAWLSGGSFGPEGSVLCFIGMVGMALFIMRARALAPSPEVVAWYPPPEVRGAAVTSVATPAAPPE